MNGNGSSQQEMLRPGFVPGRPTAEDLMDKAQKAMVAIAEFIKEVREHQQARVLQSKVSPIQHPVAPPRKNYTPTDPGHRKVEGVQCPECQDEMRQRTSVYGDFLGCVNYPACQGKRTMTGKVPASRGKG